MLCDGVALAPDLRHQARTHGIFRPGLGKLHIQPLLQQFGMLRGYDRGVDMRKLERIPRNNLAVLQTLLL